MVIEIAGHRFEGPYASPWSLGNDPGVYAVLCEGEHGYRVIDVGESEAVRDRVADHDRMPCWAVHCRGPARAVAVRYMRFSSARQRRELELEVRAIERPPCGEL